MVNNTVVSTLHPRTRSNAAPWLWTAGDNSSHWQTAADGALRRLSKK